MFRTLNANEIECRVATIKKNGLSLLLYKDARCDMKLLDETVGAFNWQREHKLIGDVMYCGISIKHDGEWVTKWDAGTESYTEKEKGQASDSFKRAGFNWGIGRELYTSPFIWITPKNDKEFRENGNKVTTYSKFSVSEIKYDEDRNITHLVIIDQDGQVRFRTKNFVTVQEKVQENKQDKSTDETYRIFNSLKLSDEQVAKWCNYYKVDFPQELTETQLQFIIDRFRKLGDK